MVSNFPILKNDRVIRAAKGEKPDKIPVWIMRQAGRYLPEFQELSKQHTFFEICRTPELACEVTMLPIRRFDLDAAIIFSDILVVPQALGMEVIMTPGQGPVFPSPLTIEGLNNLNVQGACERLQYVGDAITLTRHRLDGKCPLFGFSGAPWTLMAYMIDGGTSKTYSKSKKWLYCHPEQSRYLLNLLCDVVTDYLVLQIEAGAQIVQVFDSCADYLNKELYSVFCLPVLKAISHGVRNKLQAKNIPEVPMVLFAKGAHFCMREQTDLGYEVLGVDWTQNPSQVRELFKNTKITLQGNLDPCALYAPKETLVNSVKKMLREFGGERYIANLGHGIYPDTPIESVKTFIEAVHEFNIQDI